jgi:hypothetical protein
MNFQIERLGDLTSAIDSTLGSLRAVGPHDD